jgi:hypothetical protein
MEERVAELRRKAQGAGRQCTTTHLHVDRENLRFAERVAHRAGAVVLRDVVYSNRVPLATETHERNLQSTHSTSEFWNYQLLE